MEMETRISGIPCVIRLARYFRQKPNTRADNPDDYYGYVDLEWQVCDRNGRPAPWLDKKLTASDRRRIEAALIDALEGATA